MVMAGGYDERQRPGNPCESGLSPGLDGLAGPEDETHAD